MMVAAGLSTQQVSQVRALVGLCEERDGYSMEARLDFGTLETRPEGSFSDVLWYEKSREGTQFARAVGTRHSHSEYTMDLDVTRIPSFETTPDPVELRLAGAQDVPVMAAIVASAFAEPAQEEQQALVLLMKDPARTTYLAAQDGRPVGVIQSAVSDGRVFIVHFAVRPEMQGQGIGRQMLLAIVHGLMNSGSQWTTIEVETENRNALSLYQRCGFVTVNATDYELLELPRIPTAPELLFDQ
jgi:ribosomal protein S18 acetylase RimI-like enzyme